MKLPPLNALRVFDAVAKAGSVKAAAEQLCVTPAAVTQQVKLLERSLGVLLLRRQGRGVELTEAGRRLHVDTARHLRAINEATDRVRPRKQRVKVTTVPTFAVRWLVPRLKRLMDQWPDVEMQVDAQVGLVDLSIGDWDLAIREGQGRYPGTESKLLFPLEVVPVCAPEYARRVFRRKGAVAWSRARLLHEVTGSYWRLWFDHVAIQGIDVGQGLHFSHTAMAIAAALDGQGVALVPLQFVESELGQGTLVLADARSCPTGSSLFVVWSSARDARLSQEAERFRDWVLAEACSARTAELVGRVKGVVK